MAPSVRERKPGPPLLEKGMPEPAGKGKPRTKAKGTAARKKAGGAATAKGKGSKAGQAAALAAASLAKKDAVAHADMVEEDGEEEEEEVFCVCRGKDDGRPMIMCEACENWFHFSCIGLSPEQAQHIATYYCRSCEEAGAGRTEWNTLPPQHVEHPPLPVPMPMPMQIENFPTLQQISTTNALPELVDDEDRGGDDYASKNGDTTDEDYDVEENTRQRRLSSNVSKNGKRRKRVVEDEDDKEEQTARSKKRASVSEIPVDRFGLGRKSGAGESKSSGGIIDASPTENKTRKHCAEQLTKLLTGIFQSPNEVQPSRASELALAVEAELFEHFSEVEKNERGPRQKYTSKFRTLHFNLKNNEYFRSRVATAGLDAAAIVAMDQENLLTPEARAEQDALRKHSLAQSVKVAAVQPKTRITHKGEEVIDEFDSGMLKYSKDDKSDRNQAEQTGIYAPSGLEFDVEKERSRSISLPADTPTLASTAAHFPDSNTSPVPDAPAQEETSPLSSHRKTSVSHAPDSPEKSTFLDSPTREARPDFPHHARSDSISKTRLDLDSVWGQYKAPAAPSESPAPEKKEKAEDDMDTESDEDKVDKEETQGKQEPEYDPFASTSRTNADDDFDAIINGETNSRGRNEHKPPEVTEESAKAPQPSDLSRLPSVWTGPVIHPEEGGYPAKAVQVGGSTLGTHPHIWEQILPRQITISGRIDVKSSSEYLVQNRFANSREIVVLALLPNGSTDGADPSMPNMEKAVARRDHLITHLSEASRYGVAPPSADLKRVVKDHYLVPLKRNDPLPDYIELLDDHLIDETGVRMDDLLLSVLVLQKGTLTGSATPKPHSASPPLNDGRSPAPFVGTGASPAGIVQNHVGATSDTYRPGEPNTSQSQLPLQQTMFTPSQPSNLPALDNAALQSLLSNPALLQSLSAVQNTSQNPTPGPPLPAMSPPYPPQSVPFNSAGSPYGSSTPPSQWPQQTPSGVSQPTYPHQVAQNQWNSAALPNWQGNMSPPHQPGWQASPPFSGIPPPQTSGFIHPERIRQASQQAREIANRLGKSQPNQESSQRYNRDPDARSGPHREGRGNDRRGSGGNTVRGGNSRNDKSNSVNQMHAGIQDRGWGRR